MNCINPYGFRTLALGALLSLSSLGLHAQNAVPQSAGSDLTRQQLAAFDQFLDSHPDLAGQIRKDPSLVNREEYVENHPELRNYLQDHPGLREELTENPNAVMHQEQRFDRGRNATRTAIARMGTAMSPNLNWPTWIASWIAIPKSPNNCASIPPSSMTSASSRAILRCRSFWPSTPSCARNTRKTRTAS